METAVLAVLCFFPVKSKDCRVIAGCHYADKDFFQESAREILVNLTKPKANFFQFDELVFKIMQ